MALFFLSVLYDAAVRIGTDADAIFLAFVGVEGPLIRYITSFPARKPTDKAIAAMGFSALDGPDGFKYKKNW